MPKANGPRIRLEMSCIDCQHEASESYACQGDSGHDVYCTHPTVGQKYIGDSRWETPDWCPLRTARIEEFLRGQLEQLASSEEPSR